MAPKPEFLKDRLAYYVAGVKQWRYAAALAQNANQIRSFYLHRRTTDEVGVLNEQPPTTEPPDRYTYDPLDTRPGALEHDGTNFGWWPHHYLSLTGSSLPVTIPGTGLIYETSPFVDGMEVVGFPKFLAWMSIDTPDTDFQVMLDEVFPDGRTPVLTTDYIRARYRESLEHEKLVKAGEIGQYQFSSFRFVARRIAKGNRLRLVITSPNSIFADSR